MVPKGPGCIGCPLHAQSGQSMCPDLIREQAPLMIAAQGPGEDEIREGQPKVGKTGQQQARYFMPKAGVTRADVSLSNVIRCRWRQSNDLPPVDSVLFRQAAKHCNQAYGHIPEGCKLILAEGDYAAYHHTGEKVGGDPSDSWRGYIRPHISSPGYGEEYSTIWSPSKDQLPVLVTQHTAYLFHNPAWQPILLRDWGKAARYLAGTWPRQSPIPNISPPEVMPQTFSFDTEFSGSRLTRWSAADRGGTVWVVEASNKFVPLLKPDTRIITQNALADIGFLTKVFGEGIEASVEDTMLAHAVLFSDLPHNLNFLGSIYSSMNRWKHLGYQVLDGNWIPQGDHTQQVTYSGADAWGTLEVWHALEAEFARDPSSHFVYRNVMLPLVSVIDKAQRRGMRVQQGRLAEVQNMLAMTAVDARAMGQASVGFPINLASPSQIADYLYTYLKISPRRKPG